MGVLDVHQIYGCKPSAKHRVGLQYMFWTELHREKFHGQVSRAETSRADADLSVLLSRFHLTPFHSFNEPLLSDYYVIPQIIFSPVS